ncbi:MAG: heterodisulfide reductase, subunit B [Deltaproteobacteria bacterium]|nr:heterodisulfide reductase, subunit B [Deltaproteobacteria bacterium]
MKLAYYPGCTLKTKALNLEESALGALEALGVEVEEMPRWNCCGALFSLADDDLIHHVAPVRNLIRAMENGCDTIVTMCSQCYNTLTRANLLMRENTEKRDTLNDFMDEEPDYEGGVEVVHFLSFLRDQVGFDALAKKVVKPLKGMKVAPFYGCNLVRPDDAAIAGPNEPLLEDFVAAIGGEPVAFSAARECCGSYQAIAHPDAGKDRAAAVLGAANRSEADALVLSCPMCEYNLGTCQGRVIEGADGLKPVPTYYFTQLLAVALGLEPEVCRFDIGDKAAVEPKEG